MVLSWPPKIQSVFLVYDAPGIPRSVRNLDRYVRADVGGSPAELLSAR